MTTGHCTALLMRMPGHTRTAVFEGRCLPLRAVGPSPFESRPASPMLARGFGMQLHAAVTVDGRDRKRLERVCRYLLRPPFALDAVQRTADGQVPVHFKKPNRFGASYAQMTPHAFLARLCALVPPPRAHTVVYYGVLSAHHALRSAVVPRAEHPVPESKQLAISPPSCTVLGRRRVGLPPDNSCCSLL